MNIRKILESADAEYCKKTVSEVPMDGIHPRVKRYIEHTAGVLRAPTNFVYGSVITIIGAVLGRKITVKTNIYQNRCNLFSALVGTAGSAKSPTINHCLSPLNKIEKSNYSDFMRAFHAAKDSDSELPIFDKQMIASNETIENLYRVLFNTKSSDNGLLMHQDELLNFFGKNAGKYSDGNFITDFLTLFDAFSPLRVGRVRMECPMEVDEPFLAILGGVQKKRVDELFFGQEHNGFFSRWLFWLPNEESSFIEDNDNQSEQDWEDIIDRATSTDFPRMTIKFRNSSQWLAFDDEIRRHCLMLEEDDEDELAETIKKQGYIIRRVAAAVHSLNALAEGYLPKEFIGEDTLGYAIQVVEWLFQNACIVQRVIEEKKKRSFSTKDAILALHENYGIENQSMLSAALGGRPSQQYIAKVLREAKKK